MKIADGFWNRFPAVALLAAVALAAAPAGDVQAQQSVPPQQIRPGTTEYNNITTSADFMTSMGDNTAAQEVLEHLRKGEYYIDPTFGAITTTHGFHSLSSDNRISLPSGVATQRGAGVEHRSGAPAANFQATVDLAKTLFHENIHTHQPGHRRTISGASQFIGSGSSVEIDAWSKTIAKQGEWAKILGDKAKKDLENPNTNPLAASVHAEQYNQFMTSYEATVDYGRSHEAGGNGVFYGTLDLVTGPGSALYNSLNPEGRILVRKLAIAEAEEKGTPYVDPFAGIISVTSKELEASTGKLHDQARAYV